MLNACFSVYILEATQLTCSVSWHIIAFVTELFPSETNVPEHCYMESFLIWNPLVLPRYIIRDVYMFWEVPNYIWWFFTPKRSVNTSMQLLLEQERLGACQLTINYIGIWLCRMSVFQILSGISLFFIMFTLIRLSIIWANFKWITVYPGYQTVRFTKR